MAAATSRTDSLNGLKTFGATVKDLTGTALGAQSYRYQDYFIALAANTVIYPCLVAVQDLEKKKGFSNIAMGGRASQTNFNIIHFLLHYQVAGTASYKTKEPDIVTMEDHYDTALALFSSTNMGWSAISNSGITLIDPMPAIKFTFEGVTYHASIYKFSITIFL